MGERIHSEYLDIPSGIQVKATSWQTGCASHWATESLGVSRRKWQRDVIAVIEVKAHRVDATKITEVMESHGIFDYGFVIAAQSYKEGTEGHKNVALVQISSFVQLLTILTSIKTQRPAEATAKAILRRYNRLVSGKDQRPDLKVSLR